MPATYDVAVVGLGAVGSAATEALACRGLRVIGLDRFRPPHPFGSTHGRSRIIREAYYESPAYVPLVQRAYREWDRLAAASGRTLLRQTGGLMLGAPDGELIAGARLSAESHRLPHDLLDTGELRRRFPHLRVMDGTVAVWEPRAGFLDPEACVSACLELAVRGGAELRLETPADDWRPEGDSIRLTAGAERISCGTMILAAGPWLPGLLGRFLPPLVVERQVMWWFRPASRASAFTADHHPVFIWEWENGRFFYGIPDHGHGVKVAVHHEGRPADPDRVERGVSRTELDGMRNLLRRFIPDLDGEPVEHAVCLYTNTPDHHFLLGPHPDQPRVLLASACSGHGFKFASALGEVLADLVERGETEFDLGPFDVRRF
ncbi:MAG TPA: N-methyl-L-tryptophan oxidase [Gemmatimonadales bacterium]|nr:N-methyl-L-tryptophan oxidase [Gemmatimonadales bacterium]